MKQAAADKGGGDFYSWRLALLLLQLLKWQHQSGHRSAAWQACIRLLRRDLRGHLADNGGLQGSMADCIAHAYGNARIEAAAESGLAESSFPTSCPWSFEQLLDDAFWPQS